MDLLTHIIRVIEDYVELCRNITKKNKYYQPPRPGSSRRKCLLESSPAPQKRRENAPKCLCGIIGLIWFKVQGFRV